MPSGDLTDVTLVSEDHEGPDDHNYSDDSFYHYDHDESSLMTDMKMKMKMKMKMST